MTIPPTYTSRPWGASQTCFSGVLMWEHECVSFSGTSHGTASRTGRTALSLKSPKRRNGEVVLFGRGRQAGNQAAPTRGPSPAVVKWRLLPTAFVSCAEVTFLSGQQYAKFFLIFLLNTGWCSRLWWQFGVPVWRQAIPGQTHTAVITDTQRHIHTRTNTHAHTQTSPGEEDRVCHHACTTERYLFLLKCVFIIFLFQ